MIYQIELSKSSQKSLKKIPDEIRENIISRIDSLKEFTPTMRNIKRLKGRYKNLYRLRVGEYRILFQVKGDELIIIVIDILPRKDAYRP